MCVWVCSGLNESLVHTHILSWVSVNTPADLTHTRASCVSFCWALMACKSLSWGWGCCFGLCPTVVTLFKQQSYFRVIFMYIQRLTGEYLPRINAFLCLIFCIFSCDWNDFAGFPYLWPTVHVIVSYWRWAALSLSLKLHLW